jgi:hypothetical protein
MACLLGIFIIIICGAKGIMLNDSIIVKLLLLVEPKE